VVLDEEAEAEDPRSETEDLKKTRTVRNCPPSPFFS